MSDIAIKVENVTKIFRVHQERNNSLKDKFLYAGREKYRDYLALQNVSFNIKRGTTTGLIGANGSGKSTLLKIISKILYPEIGSVKVVGRMSSLLELGAGFHPDFTGVENIYLNASLMGLNKREIDKKLDEIISFSELDRFIFEPIRSYSSGMHMRLAFSVATALDPDIMLLDEILAVGDAAFQEKCFKRLYELKSNGVTIIMVSHDTSTIERFCDTAVWLQDSRVRAIGDPAKCIFDYLNTLYDRSGKGESNLSFDRSKYEFKEIPNVIQDEMEFNKKISLEVLLISVNNLLPSVIRDGKIVSGNDLIISLGFIPYKNFISCTIQLKIENTEGIDILNTIKNINMNKEKELVSADFIIKDLNISCGFYEIKVNIVCENNGYIEKGVYSTKLEVIYYPEDIKKEVFNINLHEKIRRS